MRKLLFFTFLSLSCFPFYAQVSEFNLSFRNGFVESNKFCADVEVSFDEEANLGTSNFVFTYDVTKLANPSISIAYLSPPPAYLAPTISQPSSGRVSLT